MANTAKTKTATKTKKSEENVANIAQDDVILKENEALKAQLASMQAQMELLTKQMHCAPEKEKAVVEKSNKNITFVNMTKGAVILRGTQLWRIDGQFSNRSFSEREARAIVSNMNNFVRSGAVYIVDKKFVDEMDLADSYENILSDVQLKELLAQKSEYVIEAYSMVSEEQKKIIIDMIVEKRTRGENVDANILMRLGELSGKDLISIEKDED